MASKYQTLIKDLPGFPEGGDLASFINALFTMAIVLGITVSVLIIAYAGFEYMTIDVAMKKKGAIMRIRRALTGLLMLLATYIIFHQINPDILKLKVL